MKFRCLYEPAFIDVEADSELGAQEMAFARTVRDLSPTDFVAWPTGPQDEWREIETCSS